MAYKDKKKAIENNNKFIANAYDRINLTVPKGTKEIIQAAASRSDESVNGFINRLIFAELNRMEREQHNAGGNYDNLTPADFPQE